MKKILSIGNSFGVDSARYIYSIARAGGERVKIVGLFIGACSLKKHHKHMIDNDNAYELYLNGASSGIFVNMKEALLSDEWDAVVFQHVSYHAGNLPSFFPYIEELSAFVKKCAPNAKQYMHQTWTYPEGSSMFDLTPEIYKTREEMIPYLKSTCEEVVKRTGMQGVIPSLLAMTSLYEELGNKIYRDDLHASYGLGRFALGCVWYGALFNKNPEENDFCDLDEPCDIQDIILARKHAKMACEAYGYLK